VAVSNELPQIQQAAALAAQPGSGGFAKSGFHARLAEAYGQGVTWLLGADMQSLIPKHAQDDPKLQRSGFGDLRYLIVERKDVGGRAENHAILTFAQPRHGLASWLAAPAPMRVLDYVSPDATLAVAALAKNPPRCSRTSRA